MSSLAYAIVFTVCTLTAPGPDPATHTFSKCHMEQKVMHIPDPEKEGFTAETDQHCLVTMFTQARLANMPKQWELMKHVQTKEWPLEMEVIKEGGCQRLTDA
ncbi:MAG: hypothetical protein ACWGQW_00030 [bacterium]